VKLYCGSVCGLVGQVVHCEIIYWECIWFGGTGRALGMYILGVRVYRCNRKGSVKICIGSACG